MSLHMYRGSKPRDSKRAIAKLSNQDLEEKMATTKKNVSAKLRLDDIINNRPMPPCSLVDFMDYLVYVEGNAEYLQFFWWYCDYIRRWTKLSSRKKARSPKWDPDTRKVVPSYTSRTASPRETKKMEEIMNLIDTTSPNDTTTLSLPRIPEPAANADSKSPTTPSMYYTQPFRQEITNIVHEYIALGSPRQLELSPEERSTIIHAVQDTTHPSALLPAFINVEAVLRGYSHPNFIDWNIANANTELIIFLRLLSVFILTLAVVIDVLFIANHVNQFVKLAVVPFWFIGFVILLTSGKGISVFLHFRGKRQIRPWEQTADVQAFRSWGKSGGVDLEAGLAQNGQAAKMKAIGGRNTFDDEEWLQAYQKRSVICRVFERSTHRCNPEIKAMQNKIVISALVWSAIIAALLGVGTNFIPNMV